MEHWFWVLLTFLTITWYLVVTLLVAYKGAFDIKEMIGTLKDKKDGIDEQS